MIWRVNWASFVFRLPERWRWQKKREGEGRWPPWWESQASGRRERGTGRPLEEEAGHWKERKATVTGAPAVPLPAFLWTPTSPVSISHCMLRYCIQEIRGMTLPWQASPCWQACLIYPPNLADVLSFHRRWVDLINICYLEDYLKTVCIDGWKIFVVSSDQFQYPVVLQTWHLNFRCGAEWRRPESRATATVLL